MSPAELLERVVAASGIASVVGRGMITRALADGGVEVDRATLAHYERALPKIGARLKAYCLPTDFDTKLAAVTECLRELREGSPRADGAAASAPSSEGPSGERAVRRLTPAGGVWIDDEVSVSGRRWTADELKVIEASRTKA